MAFPLTVNGDTPSPVISGAQVEEPTRSPSNCLSIVGLATKTHTIMGDNPEKPPYGTTIVDVECHMASSRPKSVLHVLHLISVVVASSTINGVVFGVVNNFGVFYVYLIELFKSDTSLLVLTSTEEQFPTTDMPVDNSTSVPTDSAFLQPLIGKSLHSFYFCFCPRLVKFCNFECMRKLYYYISYIISYKLRFKKNAVKEFYLFLLSVDVFTAPECEPFH